MTMDWNQIIDLDLRILYTPNDKWLYYKIYEFLHCNIYICVYHDSMLYGQSTGKLLTGKH